MDLRKALHSRKANIIWAIVFLIMFILYWLPFINPDMFKARNYVLGLPFSLVYMFLVPGILAFLIVLFISTSPIEE